MKRIKILGLIIILGVFLIFPKEILGQETDKSDIESCFKYYDYGRVKTNLGVEKASYNSGETAKLLGTIINSNTFPLRDVILYGQLKRVNDGADFLQNGHFLIDKFTLLSELNFLAGEHKKIVFDLPLMENYPAGDYQLQYFIFSKQGFNYGGRNFLEEDIAGVSNFTIKGNRAANVYFDPNSLTVNGEEHHIREQIVKFPMGVISIAVNLAQNSENIGEVTGSSYFYSYDDALESNLVNQEDFVLNAENNYRLNIDFTPESSGAFVFLARIDSPVASMIKYRFAVEGNDPSPLRINDLGITSYPPSATDRAYLCFHSATDRQTPPYTIRLSVYDAANNLLEKKEMTATFDSDVAAISIPMDKVSGLGDFSIRGEAITEELADKNQIAEFGFTCDNFAGSVTDFNLSYDINNPDSLVLESTVGCGASGRIGGVIDLIRVKRNGQTVREDYNSQIVSGEYSLDELPSGDYTVEVEKGDLVKVLSISVPKKSESRSKSFIILLLILAAGVVLAVFFILRRRKKRESHEK